MTNTFELLVNAARKFDNRIAVKDDSDSFTYSELLKKSLIVGSKIETSLNQSRNNLVFIFMSKTAKSLVAIWSVIASGNYYACIDAKTSSERVKYLVEKMKPALIIDVTGTMDLSTYEDSIPKICLDEVLSQCADCSGFNLEEEINKALFSTVISMDPLYMVFTSGSTGYPKAIIKNHKSILAFSESFISEFGLSDLEYEVFGNQASFDYDVSAKDIYISVRLGATLCIIPSKYFLTPAKLAQFMFDNNITILIWAASAIKFMEKFNCFDACKPISIKHVFFSGEPMPVKCIDYWAQNIPNAEFFNLYAPSEVTGNCLYYKYEGNENYSHLPLENTFSNSEVLFLTESKEIAKDGQKGEAYVRGEFLAQGYYMDCEQTQSRFIQNPLHNLFPDIVYKTGDYFTLSDGKFIFSGRVDNQIKHMGHRIELEEIEAAILRHINNSDFCILYDTDKENIIMLTQDDKMDFKTLLVELKAFLPKYMLPYKAFYVRSIPLNDRGKVDRKQAYNLYKEEIANA